MPEILFQPLGEGPAWDGPAEPSVRPCQFKATYSATERELLAELKAIGVRTAVLELDLSRGDLRVTDGLPRAGSSPRTSRVRLSFQHRRHGRLSFACWTYSHWHDNVRAIRMTLEALRAVDRYGAVQGDKQYTGFKQLPGGSQGDQPSMTVEEAAYFIAQVVSVPFMLIVKSHGIYREAYRDAAKVLHPDAGGDEGSFKKLQGAKLILDRHHTSEGAR